MARSTFWIAPRQGQDWTDPDVARACDWLESFADPGTWDSRLERAASTYIAAGEAWKAGAFPPLFDPDDQIGWLLLQARTYATDRALIEPATASRVVSILQRFGKDLGLLQSIGRVEDRVVRLMRPKSAAPNILFELLVALAYRRNGWTADFIAEQQGGPRTHEFNVFRQRSRWAVECKWMGVPQIAVIEKDRVEVLSAPVHAFTKSLGLSIFAEVEFLDDAVTTPDLELINAVETAMMNGAYEWQTPHSRGRLRLIDFAEAKAAFAHDDIFYGASRMIELLTSELYDHDSQYSFRGDWTEAKHRPRYARSVTQASIIRWRNTSEKSERLKAKHLKNQVVRNLDQFPGDRPAVMHVGFDATTGRGIQARRDLLNRLEMWNLNVGQSRLRWVYGHYLAPEATTQRNESAGTEETAAPYRVNRHRTPAPLRDTLLLTDGIPHRGGHWMFPQA